jgi:hypothetical protein
MCNGNVHSTLPLFLKLNIEKRGKEKERRLIYEDNVKSSTTTKKHKIIAKLKQSSTCDSKWELCMLLPKKYEQLFAKNFLKVHYSEKCNFLFLLSHTFSIT